MMQTKTYNHDSDNLFEALGISRPSQDVATIEREIMAKLFTNMLNRTSLVVQEIIEKSDSVEEAVMIALKIGGNQARLEMMTSSPGDIFGFGGRDEKKSDKPDVMYQ